MPGKRYRRRSIGYGGRVYGAASLSFLWLRCRANQSIHQQELSEAPTTHSTDTLSSCGCCSSCPTCSYQWRRPDRSTHPRGNIRWHQKVGPTAKGVKNRSKSERNTLVSTSFSPRLGWRTPERSGVFVLSLLRQPLARSASDIYLIFRRDKWDFRSRSESIVNLHVVFVL